MSVFEKTSGKVNEAKDCHIKVWLEVKYESRKAKVTNSSQQKINFTTFHGSPKRMNTTELSYDNKPNNEKMKMKIYLIMSLPRKWNIMNHFIPFMTLY